MPRLWNETIDEHRRAVRDATLDCAATLVAERGLRAVTMSQIAKETGIGRATLYKYFPDVDAILLAWHERQVGGHLKRLAELRDQAVGAEAQLEVVLHAYAQIQYAQAKTARAAALHQGEHVADAHEHLATMVRDLIGQAATDGALRDDIAPAELTEYALHALAAAPGLRSKTAVDRLVKVTLDGLRTRAR